MKKILSYMLIAVLLLPFTGCEKPKNINSAPPISSAPSHRENFKKEIERLRKGKFQNGFDLLNIPYKIEKIDFKKVKLKKDQDLFVYYCDKNYVLYAIIDFVGDYYLPQELCVWDISRKKTTTRVKINQGHTKQSVLSAAMLNNAIIYSTTDWNKQSDNKMIWEVNLAQHGKIINLDKGICRNRLDLFLPLLYRTGEGFAYAFENIDLNEVYTYGAKIVLNGQVKMLDCHTGDLSEKHSNSLLTCQVAGSKTHFVYFIEKENKGIFHVVDMKGNLKVIPLKGKIYTYALLKDSLFQSVVLHENEQDQVYKFFIDDFSGENQYDVNTYREYYRPESNGDDNILAVNYAFDIFLFGVKDGKTFRSKVDFPEYDQRSVEFFNIDKNSYYMFFIQSDFRIPNDTELYKRDYALFKITFDLKE